MSIGEKRHTVEKKQNDWCLLYYSFGKEMNMVKIICGIDYDLFAYIKMKVAIDDDKEEDNIEKWNEIEERIVIWLL